MDKHKMYAMIISSIGLMFLTVGVTYSFFNYTKTGNENTLGTGRIYFNTTEGPNLNMTNIFPMTSTEASSANLDSVTVGIVGDTNYNDGEEYKITLVDVNNTINGKEIPINYIATYTAASGGTVGSSSDTYWTSRNSKDASIYTLESSGEVSEGKQVLVGYIDNGSTGISGTLSIKAYIDADRIAISDTYNGPNSTPTDQNGTTSSWVNGRTVFTTTEWNSLTSNPISFKIKTESNEGLWAYPAVPSCQGCKFYYAGDSEIYTTWNTNSETPTVITTGSSDNYLDIVAASGKPYFLGLKLNSSNQVTNVSTCGIKSNIPFCIEVTQSGTNYEETKEMLQSSSFWNNTCYINIWDQGTSSQWEETFCPLDPNATTDDISVKLLTDGSSIVAPNGGFCSSYSFGTAVCYDEDPN